MHGGELTALFGKTKSIEQEPQASSTVQSPPPLVSLAVEPSLADVSKPVDQLSELANDPVCTQPDAQIVAADSIEEEIVAKPQLEKQIVEQFIDEPAQVADMHGTVASLADTFTWARFDIANAKSEYGGEIVGGLYNRLRNFTFATAFSGIDAPAVALKMLSVAVSREYGWGSCPQPQNLSSIEWNDDANLELRVSPCAPQCMHKNILDFLVPASRSVLESMQEYDPKKVYALVSQPGVVKLEAHCQVCQAQCRYKRAQLHIAGSPCVDWSAFGQKQEENGPTIIFFMVWVMMRRMLQEPSVILENVPSFPLGMLQSYLGDLYDIDSVSTCNADFGLAVRRARRYFCLTLKSYELGLPMESIPRIYARKRAGHTFHDFFVADTAELKNVLRWGFHRTEASRLIDNLDTLGREHIHAGLLKNEQDRLQYFVTHKNGSDCVCSLSQKPEAFPCMSSNASLHCILKHSHILWSEQHGRWLSAREVLQAQGFPVTNASLAIINEGSPNPPRPMCSFNSSRVMSGVVGRSRSQMVQQAGNSMCIPVGGTVLFHSLLWTKGLSVHASSVVCKSGRSSCLVEWQDAFRKVKSLSALQPAVPIVKCMSSSSFLRTTSEDSLSASVHESTFSSTSSAGHNVHVLQSRAMLDMFASACKRARTA